MTYSVCVIKATRPASVFLMGISDFDCALVELEQTYKTIKLLSEFIPNGVAVVVIEDSDIDEFCSDRHSWNRLIKYQAGSY